MGWGGQGHPQCHMGAVCQDVPSTQDVPSATWMPCARVVPSAMWVPSTSTSPNPHAARGTRHVPSITGCPSCHRVPPSRDPVCPPPQITGTFWQTWKDFEIRHGNEDTIREMLRIKRSVQATYNTQVNFMASQMLKVYSNATGTGERGHPWVLGGGQGGAPMGCLWGGCGYGAATGSAFWGGRAPVGVGSTHREHFWRRGAPIGTEVEVWGCCR